MIDRKSHRSRRQATWSFTSLILVAVLSAPVLGQDGTNDPNGTGVLGFDLDPAATDLTRDCAVQADGKVLLAGAATDDDGETLKIALARFLPGGGFDPALAGSGSLVIDQSTLGFPFTQAAATAVAVQGDRILLAGYRNDPLGSAFLPFLLRLNLDGSIDTAFANHGWFLPSGMRSVTAMEVDPATLDVWLLGPETDGSDGRYRVAKVDRFENEKFSTFVYSGSPGAVTDLELQPDHKALLVGWTAAGTPGGRVLPTLYRRLTDGSPDPSVGAGTGGWAYDYGDSRFAQAVGVRPDGKLVLEGTFGPVAGEDLFVTGLTKIGELDPAFGTRTIAFDLGGSGGDGTLGASRMVVQSDGKTVVAARALTGGASGNFADIGVARLTAAGSLDPSFGGLGTGKRTFELGPVGSSDGDDYISCLALAAGKPIVVGSTHWSGDDWDFAVQRLANALIFSDGFELGSSGAWSATVPIPPP